jgi:hypothetical protein
VTLDYTIAVPSRKRTHNMWLIRELLPSAVICIDERERDDYERFVPSSNLLLHPPMEGSATVKNWMIDNIASPILIFIPDDFVGVRVNTGSKRFITNAQDILAILENAATCCADLGLTAFCFSGTPNTTMVRPDERPIVPVQSMFRALGLMGAARHRKYREDIPGRADFDLTLRTLFLDRCIYADVRFFFDCGAVFAGRGGNVGLVTAEAFTAGTREIVRTWGRYASLKPPAFSKNRSVAVLGLRVSRTNKIAQR